MKATGRPSWAVVLLLGTALVSCGGKIRDEGSAIGTVGGTSAGARPGTGGALFWASGGVGASSGGHQIAFATGGHPSGGQGGSGGNTTGGGSSGGSGGEPPDCNMPKPIPGVAARYELDLATHSDPNTTDFFAYPWPELSRTKPVGFPNPKAASGCTAQVTDPFTELLVGAIVPQEYRDYVLQLNLRTEKFAPRHPVVYLSFDDPVSQALPSPEATLKLESPLSLINLNAGSGKLGQLTPIQSRIYNRSRFLPSNTLAVAPVAGFPLEEGSLYGLVVRRTLKDAEGSPLGSSADFEARKRGAECNAPETPYTLAFDYLESAHGIPRDEIAALVLFETGDPTRALYTLGPAIDAQPSPADFAEINAGPGTPPVGTETYYTVRGEIRTLIQQVGAPPYLPSIAIGASGVTMKFDPASAAGSFIASGPAKSPAGSGLDQPRSEPIPFVLTIPSVALAYDGTENLPVVLFAPGTGGSQESAVSEGIAQTLGGYGVATLTMTPVMHGVRAHAENIDPVLLSQLAGIDALAGTNYRSELISNVESGQLFFSPLNLVAALGNSQQAAVDYLWQAHLLSKFHQDLQLGSSLERVSFDPHRIYFFGHSQGGSTGPLLASSSRISAAIVSGTAGHLPTALLHKSKPDNQLGITELLNRIICDSPEEPLDETHPILALLSQYLEPADAELYARDFVQGPHPKSLMAITGRDDRYAAPEANHAVTTAALMNQSYSPPGFTPSPVAGQKLLNILHPGRGYGALTYGVQGNLSGVTSGFRQYHQDACGDDHFVYVCDQNAQVDWVTYLLSAGYGAPLIP